MIQAILTFQFVLNEKENGDIEPEFRPIQHIFNEEGFSEENYSKLIVENDIFAVFYQHTTSVHEISGAYSNFYRGRLKETPFQVMSYFKQVADGAQFLTLLIFSLSDEIDLFEKIVKLMSTRLDTVYESFEKAKTTKQLSLLSNIKLRLENELKFAVFQIDRLSNLDKLQKAALIFNSEERLKILNTLRECPISKSEMRDILESIKENANLDLLLEPFLELNLIRRDWVKGVRDKKTNIISGQGEYLFLTKDIYLVRTPNNGLLSYLKQEKHPLTSKYEEKVIEYFSDYDPIRQTIEETKQLAAVLLDPDVYDNFVLMRSKFYPLDKIPKIFSEFADTTSILEHLKMLNVTIEIKDKQNRTWVFLLTDIKPLIVFPEYLLPKIRAAFKDKDKGGKITHEIAKKALTLLEVAFPEEVEF